MPPGVSKVPTLTPPILSPVPVAPPSTPADAAALVTGYLAPASTDAGVAVITTGSDAPVRLTVLIPPRPDGPVEVVVGIPSPSELAAIQLAGVPISRAFTLELRRLDGTLVRTHPRPLTIAVAVVDADLAIAGGDVSRLHLLRWEPDRHAARVLATAVDRVAGTLTAETGQTSLFLIGAVPAGAGPEVAALASAPWAPAAPALVAPSRMPVLSAAPAAGSLVQPTTASGPSPTVGGALLGTALAALLSLVTVILALRSPPRLRRALLLALPIVLVAAALLYPPTRLVLSTIAALPRAIAYLGGFDAPRSFLLVGQNADEPRPTGGFMGSFGLASVEGGRLVALDYRNSREFERADAPRILPPAPLERYAGFGTWQMRDANWSPDFPTAMEQLDWFWRRDQGRPLDGAVAFTEEAIVRLLAALGPVTIPETGDVVSADNVRDWILRELYPVGPDGQPYYDPQGKTRTLSSLAALLLERLTKPAPGDLVPLARAAAALAREKHVLLWFRDPALQRLAASWGFAGAVEPADRDYLAVVDTSVSYTKVGTYLRYALDYAVQPVPAGRVLRSSLTLTYENAYDPEVARRVYPPFYLTRLYDPRRDAFVDAEGYWATWLRVYVPNGAVYRGSSGLDEPPAIGDELGKTVFGGYLALGPGERRRIRFEYDTPDTSPTGAYSLLLQRQPGIARAYDIRVFQPNTAHVTSAWSGVLTGDVAVATSLGG